MNEEKHYGGYKYRNRRNINKFRRNSLLGTLITAIAGTVINDLTSNNSKIKILINKLFPNPQIENKKENRKVLDAEYSILNKENMD